MNILNCILIDASVDEIRLTANDMELGIETIVQGTILQRGIICLDAKLLSEIVRKLPDAEVVIETDDNYQTLITSENSVFHIVGKDPSEFRSRRKIRSFFPSSSFVKSSGRRSFPSR